jgi:AmmeMemoRadiSam system protein A/AmmeMemoRadiSam system protein B
MGRITGAFIFPHPPIMVEEVGKEEAKRVRASINGALEASERIAVMKPDTIVVITPHGPLLRDAMAIASDERLEGSLGRFGAPQVHVDFDNDLELVDKIIEHSDIQGTFCVPMHEDVKRTYGIDPGMDHGALVPLYFINKKHQNFKLVHITYSLLSREQHYKLGIAIRDAVRDIDRNVVIVASGDLSHRLTKEAPAGFDPKGELFDKSYVELLKAGDVKGLLGMSPELLDSAGECAFNSTVVLLGCLAGCDVKAEILSYEGPFGVGYCIAQLHSSSSESGEAVKAADPYVGLAKQSLETYVKTGKPMSIPDNLPAELLTERAGVFVSLKKFGELRGCIGTISPTTINIAMEIIQNAISSGTRDPRFHPVEEHELEQLDYSVDVLMEPERIQSITELDVKKYGVIVRSGYKSGLLLPNLEGVDTVEEQVDIALRKAGIRKGEAYELERFEVIRHH